MIPLQTEVDGALDAAIATGEMLLSNYWWAGVLFVLAYWIRWYAVAKQQGHNTPEIIGAYGVVRHFSYSTLTAASIAIMIAVEVVVQLAWGFQIFGTLFGGLFAGHPTVWASFMTAGAAMWTGLFGELGWVSGYGPRGLIWIFLGTFGFVMALRFAAQAAREGLASDTGASADGSSNNGSNGGSSDD